MKRLALALVPLALLISACAVGEPKPPTYVSDTGVTLNANVHSSVAGDTGFWWRYGETTAYGSETAHRTVAISDEGRNEPHPVSQPVAGLVADTTYHYQFCVQDQEESPGRVVCNKDQTFSTATTGGRSGIAFVSDQDGDGEIYVMDADGSNETNLTDAPTVGDKSPAWSPDGKRIVFNRDDLMIMNADGSGLTPLTDYSPNLAGSSPAWSPDGSKIAFGAVHFPEDGGVSDLEIFVIDADGTNLTKLTDNTDDDRAPVWSPDGSKIAYKSGRLRGQRRPSDESRRQRPDSADHEWVRWQRTLAWSPDRTRIAYAAFGGSPSRPRIEQVPLLEGDVAGPAEPVAAISSEGSSTYPSLFARRQRHRMAARGPGLRAIRHLENTGP